jgi:hypothetical protein
MKLKSFFQTLRSLFFSPSLRYYHGFASVVNTQKPMKEKPMKATEKENEIKKTLSSESWSKFIFYPLAIVKFLFHLSLNKKRRMEIATRSTCFFLLQIIS